MEKSNTTGIVAERPSTRSTKVSYSHYWRSLQTDILLSNLARHQVRKALRHLLELQKHRHNDEQYAEAFRNALRCVYELQHLQEEFEVWPVAPYPTADQLGLRYGTIPDWYSREFC